MKQNLQRALPGYIQNKRWFQAKGQTLDRLEITTLDPLPDECGPDSWLCLFRVVLAEGNEQIYALLVVWRSRENGPPDPAATIAPFSVAGQSGDLVDGWTDDRLIRGLLSPMLPSKPSSDGAEAVLENTVHLHSLSTKKASDNPVSPGVNSVRATSPEMFPPGDFPAGSELPAEDIGLRRLSVEQSHSAILCGNRWFLKLYRRLTVGPNPEVEMGRFLTQRGFSAIASMVGVLEWSRPSAESGKADETLALALLQSAVDADGDAWYWMLDRLSRLSNAASDRFLRQETIEMAGRLGRRIGEMHQALAAPTPDPAFASEAVSMEDVRQWARQVEQEVTRVLSQARQIQAKLPDPVAALLQTVFVREAEILRLVDPPSLSLQGLLRTRFHGDLHLGQILVGRDGDAVIIDFEGEPDKPLAFRRRKHSPLRDVAGMLRSFSYAAHMALRQAKAHDATANFQATEFLRNWEQDANRAFLASYRSDGLSGPEEILLRLFMIEKAFYELRYELNNRPDWVGIPLSGILGLIQP